MRNGSVTPKTLNDLFGPHDTCEIVNLITGQVVRRLRRSGDLITVDALSITVIVAGDTRIIYEPWEMDRGSLLFDAPPFYLSAKLCTELDYVQYPDGSVADVLPHPDEIARLSA